MPKHLRHVGMDGHVGMGGVQTDAAGRTGAPQIDEAGRPARHPLLGAVGRVESFDPHSGRFVLKVKGRRRVKLRAPSLRLVPTRDDMPAIQAGDF